MIQRTANKQAQDVKKKNPSKGGLDQDLTQARPSTKQGRISTEDIGWLD